MHTYCSLILFCPNFLCQLPLFLFFLLFFFLIYSLFFLLFSSLLFSSFLFNSILFFSFLFFSSLLYFRLVNDSTLTPPWCVAVRTLGHTFQQGMLYIRHIFKCDIMITDTFLCDVWCIAFIQNWLVSHKVNRYIKFVTWFTICMIV